ncbi:MAG: hypothetical protein Fur0022_42660 [Anaerolineales bacterium]
MKASSRFNPEKVAYYEKAGWEAYYAKNWGRVLWLMVQLNREEFGMSLMTAMTAALDIVQASLTFKPVDNDIPKATEFLRRYFEKARRSAHIHIDAQTLAQLEMDYWVIHRTLALERMQHPTAVPADSLEDISSMVDALEKLHTALFGVTNGTARRSAELRALAAKRVDRITGGYSPDVPGDWRQIESYLTQAYQALAQ